MKRNFVILVALLVGFATATYAADLRNELSSNGEASQFMTADQMFYKAQCFMLGQDGHPQDNSKAVEWFYKAAKNGHVEAQNVLAYMLAEGVGVKKDEADAIEWWTEAAKNGHTRAQVQLGTIYDKGLYGVTKSEVEAKKWYRMAEKNGDAMARKWLAKKEKEEEEEDEDEEEKQNKKQ